MLFMYACTRMSKGAMSKLVSCTSGVHFLDIKVDCALGEEESANLSSASAKS